MGIEELDILVQWQRQLLNGKTKPHNSSVAGRAYGDKECCNTTGVVRDAKEYNEIIKAINQKLVEYYNLEV